jgi:hypothetical protein
MTRGHNVFRVRTTKLEMGQGARSTSHFSKKRRQVVKQSPGESKLEIEAGLDSEHHRRRARCYAFLLTAQKKRASGRPMRLIRTSLIGHDPKAKLKRPVRSSIPRGTIVREVLGRTIEHRHQSQVSSAQRPKHPANHRGPSLFSVPDLDRMPPLDFRWQRNELRLPVRWSHRLG